MPKPKTDVWRVWKKDSAYYGAMFYKRATGQAPEMESSKAAARQLAGILKPGMRVLDVGCGVGHYLLSLRREFRFPFRYEGVDVTPSYIRLAKKAFKQDPDAHFRVADIEDLPFAARSFDIVLCCNVLLHLPHIALPVRELWRVTKGTLLLRTLVGKTTFRIRHVRERRDAAFPGASDPLFTASGEPRDFYHYNIYSEQYMQWLCSRLPGTAKTVIQEDKMYDPAAFGAKKWPGGKAPANVTTMLEGWQVNGYVLQPWAFVQVDRKR